jgi:hypothetical protein
MPRTVETNKKILLLPKPVTKKKKQQCKPNKYKQEFLIDVKQ